MRNRYDLIIRGGTVVDGTGAEPFVADVGVADGRIADVGRIASVADEEIDAKDMLVTPGFVDIHTHYDGQVTWGTQLTPSSMHGVTTAVLGNCGVGFAPCRPEDHDLLIKVMEGVEDIPEVVMSQGIPWEWESFSDYLDFLSARNYDIDFATQIPHGPVRVYVMGRRGAEREPATPADIAAMVRIVQDGMEAGALGFSTSRTMIHRLKNGQLAPTITSGEDELKAIALGLKDIDRGVLQGVDDWADDEVAFGMWRRLVEISGRPLSLSLVQRGPTDSTWKKRLQLIDEAREADLPISGQVIGRPIGLLFGLDVSFTPFSLCPSFQRLESMTLSEKVAELRKPEVKARLLAEKPDNRNPELVGFTRGVESMYRLGNPPNYSPAAQDSIASMAARSGVAPLEFAYDLLLEDEGRALLYFPVANFGGNTLDNALTMLKHPHTVLGIGDGGAHCGMISDASTATFMLTYWTRDRNGERLPLPIAVRQLTRDTAQAVGLRDRGVLDIGFKADINVIDYDRLHIHAPHTVRDLPGGGRRIMQNVDGYVATMVSGTVTYRNGTSTDALPGRLVRGAQDRKGGIVSSVH